MTARSVDLGRIQSAVNRCCKTEAECLTCDKVRCLIGYTQVALDYARQKRALRIPRGNLHIPGQDLRVYYEPDLLNALAEVLRQCQGCRENHEEECVINIARRCLELALIGENVDYEGSALLYLTRVGQLNPQLGKELMQRYQSSKSAPSGN